MKYAGFFLAAAIGGLIWSAPAQADIIVIRYGTFLIPIEAKLGDTKQKVISVTHEKFKEVKANLPFRRGDDLFIQDAIAVPSRKLQYQKKLAEAQKKGKAERMALANWAASNAM